MMNKKSTILILGADTMMGNALYHELINDYYTNIFCDYGYNLTDIVNVKNIFLNIKPDYVFLLAGRSGGIQENQLHPASLMINNLQIIVNSISMAQEFKTKKLLYLASSCVYPKHTPQPMGEKYLMTDIMEPTSLSYSLSKLVGIQLTQACRQEFGSNFISCIPTNLYGIDDDFNPDTGHVIGSLVSKIINSKLNNKPTVEIWGSGNPRREFMFANDCANAMIHIMNVYNDAEPINIGNGFDISIRELATILKEIIGFEGEIIYNLEKPDGAPKKILDSSKLTNCGWSKITDFKTTLYTIINSIAIKHGIIL